MLRIKRAVDRKLDKYKARLVAKGFTQKEGVNYTETFATTLRFEFLRALIAYAASEGLYLEQVDVSTLFLYADIDEKNYMEIPEGMEGYGSGKVMLLHKSIYGLKQASRLWNQHLDKVLGELEYHRLTSDFGVYIKGKGENKVLMGVYVDDIIMLAKVMQILNELKGHLQLEFKMKDLGAANFIVGMKI